MREDSTAVQTYTVSVGGQTARGSAYEVLDSIRRTADSADIRKMGTDAYASALISDAAFFLSKSELDVLRAQSYASKFAQALEYLAAMPTSGVRILAVQNGRSKAS